MSHRDRPSRFPILAAALLAGCALHGAPLDPAADEEIVRPPPVLLQGQGAHGQFLDDVLAALRAGDVPAVGARLADLRDASVGEDVPAIQRIFVYGMQSEVAGYVHARDLAGVTEVVGMAAAWCSRCHDAARADLGAPLPDDPSSPTHARLGRSAAAALVDPSRGAWERTLHALEVVADGDPVHDATRARIGDERIPLLNAGTSLGRVEVFSKVWSTCSGCHAPGQAIADAVADGGARVATAPAADEEGR